MLDKSNKSAVQVNNIYCTFLLILVTEIKGQCNFCVYEK